MASNKNIYLVEYFFIFLLLLEVFYIAKLEIYIVDYYLNNILFI